MEKNTQTKATYGVQYTDDASTQIEALSDDVQATVEQRVRTLAAFNPYAHGVQVDGIPDRRRVLVDGISVYFWVSEEVKMLTVFASVQEETPAIEKPEPLVEDDEESEETDG